jgi:hypothetical protein
MRFDTGFAQANHQGLNLNSHGFYIFDKKPFHHEELVGKKTIRECKEALRSQRMQKKVVSHRP